MHTDLFRKMQRVRQLFFRCQSGHGSRMDWNHHGSGHTTITVEGTDIYFDDAFVLDNQRPCHDKKRWRFVENGVEFHHFREQQYSKIFEFVWQNGQLIALAPYGCPPDTYSGNLLLRDDSIVFTIAIQGTRKDEQIEYVYRA